MSDEPTLFDNCSYTTITKIKIMNFCKSKTDNDDDGICLLLLRPGNPHHES